MEWKCCVPAAGTEQNYLCLKNKLCLFEPKHCCFNYPHQNEILRVLPQGESTREKRCRWQQSISSLKELPEKSFEIPKVKGKARLHTDQKRCGHIYWCVCIQNKSRLFMLFVQLHYQKRGFKYKLMGLLKRWIYECIPNKTHSGRL